jgi:hypothetical protein
MRTKMMKLMVGLSAFSALAVGGASLASAASKASPPVITAPADTTQQGDQLAPDTGVAASESAPESATAAESASEAAAPNDGPGGHADDPANASVDNQFQGAQ